VCRHVAFISSGPIALERVLVAPAHGLVDQARAPRHQQSGRDNPDGWGVGWYDERGEVQRYRSTTKMWEDPKLGEVGSVCTTAAIGAARLASPGSPVEESGNAPFTDGKWLFSLNGVVDGYHEGVGDKLRATLSPERAAGIEGAADSEVLFALALDRLDEGAAPGDALAAVIAQVVAHTTGRLNMLLIDGTRGAATAWENSLFRLGPSTYASEPLDNQPAWKRIRDHSVVSFDASGSATRGLPAP
jgi:gamma-glutamyl hercynylcysteine S-oxide hydrolase